MRFDHDMLTCLQADTAYRCSTAMLPDFSTSRWLISTPALTGEKLAILGKHPSKAVVLNCTLQFSGGKLVDNFSQTGHCWIGVWNSRPLPLAVRTAWYRPGPHASIDRVPPGIELKLIDLNINFIAKLLCDPKIHEKPSHCPNPGLERILVLKLQRCKGWAKLIVVCGLGGAENTRTLQGGERECSINLWLWDKSLFACTPGNKCLITGPLF